MPDRAINSRWRRRGQAPRRPRRRASGRALGSGSPLGARPDRVAGWAFALGVLLVIVASATSNGHTGSGVDTRSTGARTGGAGPLSTTGREARLPADGVVEARTRRALARRMLMRTATWYGPGLYGRRTACGRRLTRSTEGVAHRTLPCGTRVTFYHDRHFRTVRVIDRGPYTRGVSWDLTAASARRLGLERSGPIRSAHQGRGR